MDSKTRATIARNVKRLREARDWSQVKLSKKSAIAQTAVSSVEQESGKAPTLKTLEAIADAFEIPCWMLSVGELPQTDKESLKAMCGVIESYLSLPQDGKRQLERVAEREIQYAKAS